MAAISEAIMYFISGAAFWNALVHIQVQLLGRIPFKLWGYLITPQVNMTIIICSLMLSCLLFIIARTLSCRCEEL